MHQKKLAQLDRAVRPVPDQVVRWYSTHDAARALHITPDGVRRLCDKGQLRCERTRSGARLILAHEVLDLAGRRAKARLVLLPCRYHKRLGVLREPRQLALFHPHIFSVSPREKWSSTLDRKSGDPGAFWAVSDKRGYVAR